MDQDDMTEAGGPADPQLTPKLSPKWAIGPGQLLIVSVWTVIFVLLNYVPLQGEDLWGQVDLGNWILEHRALPQADPFQRLAEGMSLVDSHWLSQTLLALVDRRAGPDTIAFLLATVTLASWLIVWRVLFLRTSRGWSSLLITGLVMAACWTRWTTVRPESLGLLAFAILWWLLESDRDRETGHLRFSFKTWIRVPLLIAVWANFDESFLCGLAVIAIHTVGALWSWLRQRRKAETVSSIAQPGLWVWLAEFAFLAAMLNPYGMGLIWHGLLLFRNANLRDLADWQPLSFGAAASYEFVAAWALGIVALRRSSRPLSIAHVLLLTLFSLATLQCIRMIGWFAVAWGIALAPQLTDVLGELWPWRRNAGRVPGEERAGGAPSANAPSFRYSYVALLLIWCGMAFTPAGHLVLGGKPRKAAQIYSRDTPFLAIEYLREHPPTGQIFNPHAWGDWIVRNGPPECSVFITSNIEQIPRRVWEDYVMISRAQPGWQNTLGRYAADTVVVNHARMPELDRALRRESTWRVVHEDDQAAIFERRTAPAAKDRKKSPTEATTPGPPDAPDGSEK